MPGHSPQEGGVAAEPAPVPAQAAAPAHASAESAPDSPPCSPAPADKMESQRRLSTSSDASSSGLNDSAHKLDATMDYIPTRMTKVSTPKPAANPLQFVKVGPCDLFKSAQETLKKVEEVKKMKREVRDEAEEWQSNLDNWKCSRRKRVEHIIDRVVEVKKFELEEHERNRRKAKTFSEMMEERTSRGRKMSLLVHKDDDANDLSDLGIGTSSDKSSVSEDYANDDSHSVDDGGVIVKDHYEPNGSSDPNDKSSDMAANGHDDETSTNTTISSPEPEEYTYDRAIQGYVNFAETRVKSRSVSHISRTESIEESSVETSSKTSKKKYSPTPAAKPRKNSMKVEEEIADIERIQSKKFSGSYSDLSASEKKLDVPKVDILKRKELFERSESTDSNEHSKVAPRAAGDLANSKSIRDRVSNLERQKSEENADKSKQVKQLASDISVKDRLSLLERPKSSDNQTKSSKLNNLVSAGDTSVPAPPTIKDRLSSLEQVTSLDRSSKSCSEVTPTSIKDRLSELEATKEVPKKLTPDRDPSFRDKLANFRNTELDVNSEEVSKSQNHAVDSAQFDEDEFYQKRTFHRSLDSLDVDSSSVISNEPYERVQSLEDLDSCGPNRNYPASASSNENLVLSSHSGDTDREDSGIHTADVSCSVSQADEPADFGDINVTCGNMHIDNGGTYASENERNMEYAPPTIVSQLAKINLAETVPLEKVSSHPEVVSPEAFCSSNSQVLVDLPNSHSSSKSSVAASKTYSGQHSSLPTIPEVSHDSPPVVFVSDTESVTPSNCTETAFSPNATSPALEVESISEYTDKTEISNLISQDMVVVPDKFVEGADVVSSEGTCMFSDSPDTDLVTCEETTLSNFGGSTAAADHSCVKQSGLQTKEEEEQCVTDDSVLVVTEDSDTRPSIDKGPKPYPLASKDRLLLMEQDLSSVTSGETDADVSSFLDQAFLEQDLKMEAPCVSGSQQQQYMLHSVPTSDVPSPVIRENDINVLPLAFPLDTSTLAEPPKEKPPPPPVELSDDEGKTDKHKNNASNIICNDSQKSNLGRLDSTKRLKKDIRRKRSDFLGIEGSNDDSYLDSELKVAPPPDMTSFLQEERRLEQELYRQMQPTLYPESDHGSNQGESRDSGVELDNHLHSHNLHIEYSHDVQLSENHSRQNSEPFGNTSSTSEEDEIIKKEREIIEILEKEEQWRYGTNTILSPSDHHQVGEKLAAKLRELEQEKMRLEWERAEESRKVAAEQAACQEEQRRIRAKEQLLREQESRLPADVPFDCDPSDMTPEALHEERERLKQEQAELDRQREMLAANQVNGRQSWDSMSSSTAHRSLQDISGSPLVGSHSQLSPPTSNTPLNYRLSLPDLQQSELSTHAMSTHHHRPPPPIPPAKPLSVVSQEMHAVNGHSRQGQLQSSSDSLTHSSESHYHRHNSVGIPSVPMAASPTSSTGSQQMTRQTLHALSAAPRSKIIATDTWVQAKRKPESQRNNNRDHYQHWLIQEAEHRRITEQQQRNAVSRKSLPPNLAPAQHSQPINQSQAWQYQHQHPHHQHTIHQIPHQHQHSHLPNPHTPHLHHHPHNQPIPPPHPHAHPHSQHSHHPVETPASPVPPPPPPPPRQEKPLPDAIIQTLTQRVQNRASMNENNRRLDNSPARESRSATQVASNNINNNTMSNMNINHSHTNGSYAANSQEKMLSVSGKKKCSHCNEELGRGAAMIIESLRLFYHMDCFKCCVCHVQLGDGLMGTDVRVRNHKLHCHNCYSSDDGVKFSCV